MQPIISIVGKSKSGKTMLLEVLIAELKRRGHKIGIIKHTRDEHEFDTVNKDTWRFSKAGAEVTAISASGQAAVFRKTDADFSPVEFSLATGACDIILTEGFKESNFPKIEVHRKDQGKSLVSPAAQLIAVVTDEPLDLNVPQFDRHEADKVADLIESHLAGSSDEPGVDVFLNGNYINPKPFLRNLLARTLSAMVSGIEANGEAKRIQISMRRKA